MGKVKLHFHGTGLLQKVYRSTESLLHKAAVSCSATDISICLYPSEKQICTFWVLTIPVVISTLRVSLIKKKALNFRIAKYTYLVRSKETKMSKPNKRKRIPNTNSNGRQHFKHLLSQLRFAACKCLSRLTRTLSSPSSRERSRWSRLDMVRPAECLALIIRARSSTDSRSWLTSKCSIYWETTILHTNFSSMHCIKNWNFQNNPMLSNNWILVNFCFEHHRLDFIALMLHWKERCVLKKQAKKMGRVSFWWASKQKKNMVIPKSRRTWQNM